MQLGYEWTAVYQQIRRWVQARVFEAMAPDVTVTRDGVSRAYTAREASPDERARLWQQTLTVYPGYQAYERRAGGRIIPIFILTPQ